MECLHGMRMNVITYICMHVIRDGGNKSALGPFIMIIIRSHAYIKCERHYFYIQKINRCKRSFTLTEETHSTTQSAVGAERLRNESRLKENFWAHRSRTVLPIFANVLLFKNKNVAVLANDKYHVRL